MKKKRTVFTVVLEYSPTLTSQPF